MSGNLLKCSLVLAAVFGAGLNAQVEAPVEKLTGDQIDGYLKGNTVYIDILPGEGAFGEGGLSPFYYGHDGKFVADLPARRLSGTWERSNDASYCVEITEVNRTFCTDVYRKDASIEHHSVGLKRLMGTVRRIVPGNDANL